MAKKSFKDDNPAMAFISPPPAAQKAAQEAAQVPAQEHTQYHAQKPEQESVQYGAHEDTQYISQEVTQKATQDITQEEKRKNPQFETSRRPIRTQGRKGKKKPRINMAFEPDVYEYVRSGAELEDMSITQYVNEILYLHMTQNKK